LTTAGKLLSLILGALLGTLAALLEWVTR